MTICLGLVLLTAICSSLVSCGDDECFECFNRGDIICDQCDGRGDIFLKCSRCNGKGIIQMTNTVSGYKFNKDCPDCENGGKHLGGTCFECNGSGRVACPDPDCPFN